MGEKEGELVQKINSLTHGDFQRFCVHHNICPEDFSPLERQGTEIVCLKCGLVVEREMFSNVIPFGSESTPGNLIADGKGLGNTLYEKGTWSVIAKGTGSNQDLPLRARQTMIVTQRHEHPRIACLLRLGRRRCAEWGFADIKEERKAIIFSNEYGKILRNVGAFLVIRNLRTSPKRVSDACLVIALSLLNYPFMARAARERYKLEERFLEQIQVLSQVMR